MDGHRDRAFLIVFTLTFMKGLHYVKVKLRWMWPYIILAFLINPLNILNKK